MSVAEEQGMVLVSVLLYLLVVTCLVVSAFSSSILQTKVSAHVNQEKQAFEYAESALSRGEDKINPTQETGQGNVGVHTTYSFQRLLYPACGLFYRVDATGTLISKVHLHSVFTFPYQGKNPCQERGLKAHRVIWEQVSG